MEPGPCVAGSWLAACRWTEKHDLATMRLYVHHFYSSFAAPPMSSEC